MHEGTFSSPGIWLDALAGQVLQDADAFRGDTSVSLGTVGRQGLVLVSLDPVNE